MATKAFQKIYTKISQITKATCSLKAKGVGYDELAMVNGKLAQVVKIAGDEVTLQVFEGTEGIPTNAEVVFLGKSPTLKVSEQLAGRFFNAFGDPIDGGPDIEGQEVEIGGPSVNPVRRKQPSELIATGIAGIDLNNTLVSGQKIPFFADPDQPFNQVMANVALRAETDKIILADKALDYRVLNLASNTFNENQTSYWHKSIGGYHAAKLRRYQEMIEEHISSEMSSLFKDLPAAGGDMTQVDRSHYPVLNMLNTRYFIFPLQGGKTAPIRNPFALGNAWFVNEVKYVGNANEEIEAIHNIDPAHVAVVDKRFANEVKDMKCDSLSSITLDSYEPNELVYTVNSAKGGTVVFSEIYYPGWQSFIDGEEVPHGRADYILRAMNVPAGKHTVRFVFDPHSLHVTEGIAYASLAILALGAVVIIVFQFRRRKE